MKTVYKLYYKSIQKWIRVHDKDDNVVYYIDEFRNFVKESDLDMSKFYTSKFDANYAKLLVSLKSGTLFSNYKSSPYYKKYTQKLKIDYPEYLI